MALSDFLPYGAPELLEGASARLARSTLTASLGVALLVAGSGAILMQASRPALPPVIIPVIRDLLDVKVLGPEPTFEEHFTPPAKNEFDPNATPEVVDDVVVPEIEFTKTLALDGLRGDGPTTEGPAGPASGSGAADRGADPAWNDFVVVDEFPALVRCAPTRYPDLARAAGVEGTVRVLMLVGRNGRVERVMIAPGGSVLLLDEAALEAARSCVFTPALTNGNPVKVWVNQSYRFSLD